MLSSQRLLKMARKWQKFAVDARRRISISRTVRSEEVELCIRPLADKGHFIVYTIDDRRFMVPLEFLKNPILLELFRMSEEQFGLPCNGPITLPCEAIFMDYVVSLIHRHVSKDVEKALVTSIAMGRCSMASMLQHRQTHQQILLHGFSRSYKLYCWDRP